jgi:hypothetical protein
MKKTIKNLINSYKLFYSWELKSNYFIVSSGRTATKFFANFFMENFDNVLALHEPAPDLFDVGMDKYRYPNKFVSTKSQLKKARYSQYKKLIENNFKIYIESNPNLSFLLPEVKKIFPNAKILYITRDLPSYLLSAYNKSPDNSNKMHFYADNDHRKRLSPIDINDTSYIDLWSTMSRERKIAWFWTMCNNIILEDIRDMDYLHVKYEDIFIGNKKIEELKKIIKYFELPFDESRDLYANALSQKKNTNSKKILTKFNEIKKIKRDQLFEMTYATRKALGYIK